MARFNWVTWCITNWVPLRNRELGTNLFGNVKKGKTVETKCTREKEFQNRWAKKEHVWGTL